MTAKYRLDGGVMRTSDNRWSVWCTSSEIETEAEALATSQWLHDTLHEALDEVEWYMSDHVIRQFRDHAADVHSNGCPQRLHRCECGRSRQSDELLREAAARIEVAIETLEPMLQYDDPAIAKVFRAAYYALTAARK